MTPLETQITAVALACLSHAADFGTTDLAPKPPLFPVGKAPNHLTTGPGDSIGLNPVPAKALIGPAKPAVPLYRLYLSWTGSGDSNTVYRVRGVNFTNSGARPTNAWTWPVLLVTNATSVIFSNDWKPGHGAWWRVSASNANTLLEVPLNSKVRTP